MLLRVVANGGRIPRGARLAPGIALVVLEGAGRGGAGIEIGVGGQLLAPPYGTVEVGTERAPSRIAAFRLPAAEAGDGQLLIEQDDGESVALHVSELEADPLSIAAGLDVAARHRLLDFLLTFCCPAFKLGRLVAFAQTCARLALDCAESAGTASVLAQVLPGYVLAGPIRAGLGATLVLIGRDRIVPGRFQLLTGEEGLQVVPRPEIGDLLVAVGMSSKTWTVDLPPALPHVLTLPGSGPTPGTAARAACRRALAASPSPAVRTLLRDMDLLFPAQPCRIADPAQPVAGELELAVPDGAGGLFVSGWLRDPLRLVEEIVLATDAARLSLPSDAAEGPRRPDIDKKFTAATHAGAHARGLLLHVPDLPGGETLQPHLLLRLRSGAELRLTPPARSLPAATARDVVLGCVPPGLLTPPVMRKSLAPAAARLHRAAMTQIGKPELVQIGRAVRRPSVSFIVPLYRNLGFLRFQIAALAQDPQCRGCELVCVLDSPEQRAEVEHLLRGLHRLTEMPVSLVVMPRNLGYAAACNAGARVATAPLLLLLNSDVIPAGPGWLGPLMAPFARSSVAAAGPKLLFDDGSIQHAGLFFERDEDGIWFNRHYHKGMPRGWADAAASRRVPGVTGAALLVRRALFERLGGVCEDYIIGDYEDSDLCLRIREAGGTILYVPEAELFHFERRSIQL
ncbi:MAG: glycosyltransferase, partial [Acetobacteraceae bacterium]|nr:glycosyltransferase [Acetobacteraceae bacterium]